MKKDLKRFVAICRFEKKHIPAYAIESILISARNFFIISLSASLSASAVAAAEMGDISLLWNGVKRFILALTIFAAIDTLSGYYQSITLQKMSNQLKGQIFGKVLHSSLILNNPLAQRGQVLARINQDVETVMGMFTFSLITPTMYLISGVGATILVARQDIQLCFLLYAVALALLAAQTYLGKCNRKVAVNIRKHASDALDIFLSAFANSESVKEQNLSASVQNFFSRKMNQLYEESRHASKFQGLLGLIGGISATISGIGVLFFELLIHPMGHISLGDIVFISQMAPLILTMVMSLGNAVNQLQNALVGVDRVMELLDFPTEEEEDQGKDTFLFHATENILTAQNLTCTLNGHEVFTDIAVSLKGSGITAVMGESGVGKTTFLRLVVGLYPYCGGSLQLCNQEISALTRKSIRQEITYVAQDAPLLEGSLRQNLTMGLEGVEIFSDAALQEALALAKADQWFPQSGDLDAFFIQEGANNLSGGQRQCIALARAFLAKTPIYIFDEIFAGMDRGRIVQIMENMKRRLDNQCVFIVTHDPEVAALCDHRVTLKRSFPTVDISRKLTYNILNKRAES